MSSTESPPRWKCPSMVRPVGQPLIRVGFTPHGAKEWLGSSVVERKRWRFWTDSDSVRGASDSHKHLSKQQYSEARPKKGGEYVD